MVSQNFLGEKLLFTIASPAVSDIETESIKTRASVASNGVVADMVTWWEFILTLIDICKVMEQLQIHMLPAWIFLSCMPVMQRCPSFMYCVYTFQA